MKRGMSRRDFLQSSVLTTAGATVAGAAPALLAHAGSDPEATAAGPGPMAMELTVNGTARALQVEPRTILAEALRGPLGLSGTKIACNRGACSACTVLLDGVPVCSCMVLAIDVGTRRVTTIEGLARGEVLHPLQGAFIEHDALQCGFCTPGMLLSGVAHLEHTRDPDVADVRNAISGHVCRCGTYPHVVAATLAVAKARRA
jgi:xanthine dehydrogenase YagT iron-sulfur-binding subunit